MKEVWIKGCDPAPELAGAQYSAEIWGLNSQRKNPPPWAARWFQLHGWTHMLERHGAGYFDWLFSLPCDQLYLFESQIERWPEWSKENGINLALPDRVRPFPVDWTCLPELGGNYKTNTIDWLMALAIAEGFNRIHLVGLEYSTADLWASRRKAACWLESQREAIFGGYQSSVLENAYPDIEQVVADLRGVCVGDIAGDESWARTSIEYYVGLAQGRGIEVTWNQGSGLMVNHHGGRYGLEAAGHE